MNFKWTEDERGTGPIITGFSSDGAYILEEYRADGAVFLTPKSAQPWQAPDKIADLQRDPLDNLADFTPKPEFLLLGTGKNLAHPPRTFVTAMEKLDIGVEIMDSRAAARAWGILRSEGRWIIAALWPIDHPTR